MPSERRAGRPLAILAPWLQRTVVYCAAGLVIVLALWVVLQILLTVPLVDTALVAALLLTALTRPLVRRLVALGSPPWLAALLAVLLLVGVLVGAFFWVARRVVAQFEDLQAAIAGGVEDLRELLLSPPLSLGRERVTALRDTLIGFVEAAAPSPMAGARLALELVTGTVLVLFLLFFLLKDGPGMWRWALGWVPAGRRAQVDEAGSRGWETLTAYVRGVVVIAFADAVSIGLALLLLGVPLVASLTVLTFLGAFVPIVGATVAGALAVAVTLVAEGATKALVILGVVLLVQQLEGNLLQPLVMGHAVRLHPVVILIAVTAGGLVSGIVGAVVAVPLTAVTYRVVQCVRSQYRPETTSRASPG